MFHTDGHSVFSGAQDSLRVSDLSHTQAAVVCIHIVYRCTIGTLRQCVVMLYRPAGAR